MIRAEHPFTFILFGASGHLARIKIFPALYFLALKKRLPEHYSIIGFSRTKWNHEEFREVVKKAVYEHVPEVNEEALTSLLVNCYYQAGQYDSLEDFATLNALIHTCEANVQCIRLAYLSVPPTVFSSTIELLCKSGIHTSTIPFRLIIEKPVGLDRKSAKNILASMNACFKRDEIYILDHYLGKEAVRNVYYLRHANPIIEHLLQNAFITNIQISAIETDGLEGRAGYFDSVGTLRDMVQSHLLEIVALLTMPLADTFSTMKVSRLQALRSISIPEVHPSNIIQGQYTSGVIHGKSVLGYNEEEGVSPSSRTPTFSLLRIQSTIDRFLGVPIFLKSGKRLEKKETRISIEFHRPKTLIGEHEHRNRLDIILQGEAGMKFHLQTKLGGSPPAFRPLILEDPLVCMGDCLVEHSLLILEAINADSTWFLDEEEVLTSWNIIDPLQEYCNQSSTPLHLYPSGTSGPTVIAEIMGSHEYEWME